MNIQNLQSPPDDRYNDFLLSSKGDNLQGSNMGKSNLFQNLEQLELTNSEDLNNKKKAPINYDNNLINPPKNQNKIYQISPNTYNNNINNNEVLDSSPISIAKLIQEKESLEDHINNHLNNMQNYNTNNNDNNINMEDLISVIFIFMIRLNIYFCYFCCFLSLFF